MHQRFANCIYHFRIPLRGCKSRSVLSAKLTNFCQMFSYVLLFYIWKSFSRMHINISLQTGLYAKNKENFLFYINFIIF